MSSSDRFGFEWQKYSQIDVNYERQFQGWIYPLAKDFFQGKKVLDAGCGMGRNSYWALKYGTKELTAFDFDQRSVEAARKTLASFGGARVEFKDIYDLPWQDEFDIAFCIGVIHHLANPHQAIKNLIQSVKPGGLVLIWVYGYEGNEWIVKLINPIRIYLTSKLPPAFLHFLTYFFSLPLWLFIKLFPLKSPYLKQLKEFNFFHTHSIVFDQLLPKIANYYKKDEAYQLLAKNNLKNINIHQSNQNSWTVCGYK